jgi:hypothetical protein
MALLIEKNTEILGGMIIPSIYMRIGYKVKPDGKEIFSNSINYISKESYKSDKTNNFLLSELKDGMIIPYNRDIDGEDILLIVHDKWKEFLSTDKTAIKQVFDPSTGFPVYIQEPVLDPSTGEQMTDPSTGELLWTDGDPSTMVVITTPKFANDSSIFIVDLDSSIN